MLTENVNVYRFSGVGPFAGFAAPAGGPAADAAAAGFVPGTAPGAAPAATAGAGTLPNMNERLIPKLTEKNPGPMPKLRGMSGWLEAGFKSKSPNFVFRRS